MNVSEFQKNKQNNCTIHIISIYMALSKFISKSAIELPVLILSS